jgi:hypothetical protein
LVLVWRAGSRRTLPGVAVVHAQEPGQTREWLSPARYAFPWRQIQTELDPGGRVSARILWSIIFACLPLSKTLHTSSKLLGTTTALLGALVFFEVGSKLGVHPCPDACETYFDEGIAVPMGREGETEQEAAMADALAQGDPPSKKEEAGTGLSEKALQQIDVKLLCERRKRMAEMSHLH